MRRTILIAVALFCFLGVGPTAQLAAVQSDEQRENDFWDKSFLEWGGIAARCDGQAIAAIVRLCEEIARELDFLTATAKIPFVYTGQSNILQHYMKVTEAQIENPIQVEIHAAATKESDVIGLYGRLVAGSFYTDAVES
jgi:hypothetical protein